MFVHKYNAVASNSININQAAKAIYKDTDYKEENTTANSLDDRIVSGFENLSISGLAASIQSSSVCFHGFNIKNQPPPTFTLEYKISSGAFGCVYKALCHRNCSVALKTTNRYGRNNEKKEMEIMALNHISQHEHPNMIKYFGYTDMNEKRYLVFELGDVAFGRFFSEHVLKMDVEHFYNIANQFLEMAAYLASIGIANNDINYETNMVYVISDDKIKMIDFGSAKSIDDLNKWNNLKELVDCIFNIQIIIKCSANKSFEEMISLINYYNKLPLNAVLRNSNFFLNRMSLQGQRIIAFHHEYYVRQCLISDEVAQEALSLREELSPKQPLNKLIDDKQSWIY